MSDKSQTPDQDWRNDPLENTPIVRGYVPQTTATGRWKAWAALTADGVPIANSIRRTKDECCHDSSISDPVEVVIQIRQLKPEWQWVAK